MNWNKAAKVVTLCGLLLALIISSFWWVPLPERLVQPDSQTVLWRDGNLAHTFLSPDERWRLNGDPSRLDPNYLKALYLIEDERFHLHFGVDPLAIVRAAISNLINARIVSGASTLTMQLARLLEPRPRRLSSKIVEAWRAIQLHLRIGRQQVLANYLRFLPFGGNLEGVHGASYSYFGHSAATLDAAEIATLLAVPQRPGARAPSVENSSRLKSARDQILKRMHAGGLINSVLLQESIDEPVPGPRQAMPQHLPHAARWLREQNPSTLEIKSVLDQTAQKLVQEVFDRHALERLNLDVRNGAVVVVEHETRHIAALIGGGDFFAGHDGAQIPAFDRPRHAASTLKPFLLGLAIDEGLTSPEHLVLDVPTNYGSYRPRNFSGKYSGLVTLDDALTQSLNVPFVHLIKRFGIENFIGHLRYIGLQWINPKPEFYGLAAALGTIPMSLLELTELYAGLAQDGQVMNLRALAGEKLDKGLQFLTPESAWMIRQVLKKRDRPDFPVRARLYGLAPNIHWKTGTSFGFRDAWAIGSNDRYTVGVWLGNLNRDASRYLVGAPLAGPLLFDVFDALGHQDSERLSDSPPKGLTDVEVCDFSGYLAGQGCTQTRQAKAPRKSVAVTPCPYHQKLYVVAGSTTAYPKACAPPDSQENSVLVLPAQARDFTNLLLPQAHTLASECETSTSELLKIVSPAQSTIILIPGMNPEEQEIALQANANEGTELNWFVNGRFLGSKKASQKLWWQPSLGEHLIVITDSSGRSSRKRITVRSN